MFSCSVRTFYFCWTTVYFSFMFFAASFLDLFFYQKSTIFTVIAIILQMVCLSQICSIFKFTQNPNDELDDLSKLNDA